MQNGLVNGVWMISFCKGGTVVLWSCKGQNCCCCGHVYGSCACFLMACRCLHCVAVFWHNTLCSHSWMLVTWDMIISFLVSSTKCPMGMSLPFL